MESLKPSSKIMGPAVILNKTSTIIIEPNWLCLLTLKNNLSITEHIPNVSNIYAEKTIKCDPIQLSIFGNRFMSIAEQMGRAL